MRKYRRQIENIDKFIAALEEMIDARDDMWEEEKYSNYKYMWKIQNERYIPAKEQLRESLKNFIIEVLEEDDSNSEAA
jgi:hypothetical protein